MSPKVVFEVRQFATEGDYQIDAIGHDIHNLAVSAKDFDFVSATDASRVNVTYSTKNGLTAQFRASRANCLHLKAAVQSCILPNLGID